MNLTEHFTLEEMTRSATASRLHIDNKPNETIIEHLHYLCSKVLEPARREACTPFLITSGYRCPALNKAVGGKNNSYHLQGFAADIAAHNIREAFALARIILKQPACDLVIVETQKGNVWLHVQTSVNPRRQLLTLKK